jgi:hypothetical protein
VLLWLPVFVDQAINEPGNLSVLWAHFFDPATKPVGVSQALSAWWAHLDLGTLVTGHQRVDGGTLPGALLLVAWLAAAVASWLKRDRALLALHAVAASALLLGLLSISRILGRLWDYLVLWSWGTTALLVLAVGYTAAVAGARWWDAELQKPSRTSPITHVPGIATLACAAVALLAAVASTVSATHADVPHPGVSRALGELMPVALRSLPPDGRYFISWQDSFAERMAGYSLLLELERAGFTAGMDPNHSVAARPHRLLPASEATAVVSYVTGNDVIARLKETPGAIELAHYEPPRADEVELARLSDKVAAALEAGTAAKLLPLLNSNLFRLTTHSQVPADVLPTLRQMMDLSVPASVIAIPVN